MHSLEDLSDLLEAGPLAWLVAPALGHETIQSGRAVCGQRQTLSILNLANHVIVLDSLERLHAKHQNLPHTNTWKKWVCQIQSKYNFVVFTTLKLNNCILNQHSMYFKIILMHYILFN